MEEQFPEVLEFEEPDFWPELKRGLKFVILALARSRKVWVALAALIQTIAAYNLDIPDEIWVAIDGLAVAVIGAIAWEDAAAKRAGR